MIEKTRIQFPGKDWTWRAALFCGFVLLNSFLVSPYIGWYDSGEMVGTTVCLGISHPSGQVLFHLLGKTISFASLRNTGLPIGLIVHRLFSPGLGFILGFKLSIGEPSYRSR